jgi:hypothetical protein
MAYHDAADISRPPRSEALAQIERDTAVIGGDEGGPRGYPGPGRLNRLYGRRAMVQGGFAPYRWKPLPQ